MPSRILILEVRGFQIFVCLVSLAITGNMLASPAASKPAILGFDLFVVVFAMLSLAYLTLASAYERFVFNPLLLFGLDMINTFWLFCGSVATAATLGAHSCHNKGYLKSNRIIGPAADQEKRCHEAQATTAFMFFALFAFIATTVVSGMRVRSGGLSGALSGLGSIKGSNPSMTEVSSALP